MKCPHCHKEIDLKNIKIKELKIEVETEIHDKGNMLKDIKIPKGWRLLTINEMVILSNNYSKELNLEDTWEFIEQPFTKNKEYIARFGADSVGAGFYCGGCPADSGASLGVRFCKDLKEAGILKNG